MNKLQTFLYELANFRDDAKSVERFLLKFRSMVPPVMLKAWPGRQQWTEDQTFRNWLFEIQWLVREAWREPDWRNRFYAVFWLLTYISKPLATLRPRGGSRTPIPSASAFEDGLLAFLLRDFSLAKFCANPICPAPYFFAKKVRQKYCSDACSRPAQLEAKKRYWETTGKDRRAEKKKTKSSVKGQTHGKKRRSL